MIKTFGSLKTEAKPSGKDMNSFLNDVYNAIVQKHEKMGIKDATDSILTVLESGDNVEFVSKYRDVAIRVIQEELKKTFGNGIKAMDTSAGGNYKRLGRKGEEALYLLAKEAKAMYESIKAGNDFKPVQLRQIEKHLTTVNGDVKEHVASTKKLIFSGDVDGDVWEKVEPWIEKQFPGLDIKPDGAGYDYVIILRKEVPQTTQWIDSLNKALWKQFKELKDKAGFGY